LKQLYQLSKGFGVKISQFFDVETSTYNPKELAPVASFVRNYSLSVEEQRLLVEVGRALFKKRWGKIEDKELIKRVVSQYADEELSEDLTSDS
jgi:hypothetical protein